MSVTPTALEFPSLSNIHVLVVGDVMLDRYWHGSADRVSPEAPVPVVQVKQTEARPGGAANVALNVVSLGARCTLVGLVGADEAGVELTQRLEAAGVICDLVTIDDWPTIVKLRMIAQKQQLLRTDFEEEIPQTGASERIAQLQNRVEKHLQSASLMVIEDYDKGAIEEPQGMIYAAQRQSVRVLVDPKLKPFAQYRGANVIKPNEKEFTHAVGRIRDLSTQAAQLIDEHGLDGIVLTRGGEGMDVLTGGNDHHIPARPVEVFDVTGAGDTTAATLAIGMALNWPLVDCARIANVAASLAVAKLGTAPVSGPELRAALVQASADRGVLQREQLAQAVADARHNGEKVVFTNGCFDILHAGHVTYLEEAAALGDRLVVAINDDASVTRLKGPGRPVVPVEGRGRVLAGLGCVDWVVSFAEDTPESLLKLLQPDVLVKGGDYSSDEVVGGELVRAYGGEVRVLSLVSDISTSAIVEKIKQV